jgi:thiamine-monophosphate kinase
MKLKDIGEFGFIDRVSPLGLIRAEGVVKGIGDDCAVVSLEGSDYLLVTTDLMVERVHFMIDWTSPEVLGAKALAVNFSDIAACGGRPRDAFISLAIPDHLDVEWLDGFYMGMSDLARQYQVNILGGDTTKSKSDLIINLAVTGLVGRDEILLRNTANVNDVIALTGPTGESAAGCSILSNSPDLPDHIAQPLVRAHLSPRPHVREGRFLAQSHACTAAIDVSDGLGSDLAHLCKDSNLAAIIYEQDIPVGDNLIEAAHMMGMDPLEWVLNGGEDYVLLTAIMPEMWSHVKEQAINKGFNIIQIGKFVQGRGIQLVGDSGRSEELEPKGWDHFK